MEKESTKFMDKFREKGFRYEPPFFYNNKYALRCELGVGKNKKAYMRKSYQTAVQIFDKLFETRPNCIIFEHYIYDLTLPLAEGAFENTRMLADHYREGLDDLRRLQALGRCETIREIDRTDEEMESDVLAINRFIVYEDKKEIDYKGLIRNQVGIQSKLSKCHVIHFISDKDDFVLTIYDDRGLDVVFSSKGKGKLFYEKLKPYLLEYDSERMRKTFEH